MKQSLFDAIGGLHVMESIHQNFYDMVYAHPWLGQFFIGHNQKTIERRQTQFMAEKMGSKSIYPGRDLPVAHRRMYITLPLLEARQGLLRTALEQAGLSENLIQRWLKIDHAFWGKIKKDSLDEFHKLDFKYEKPLVVEKPIN